VLLLVLTAGAGELLVNGDFELPVEAGWSELAWGDFPDTGNCRLRRQHDFHPDRDFEVMVHKLLNKGYALYQQVAVPTLDLGFLPSDFTDRKPRLLRRGRGLSSVPRRRGLGAGGDPHLLGDRGPSLARQ